MNNYSNNSNTATPNSSAKTVVIPQVNKAPITTANSAATGKSNNVQAGSNRTGFDNISNLVIKDKTFPIKYRILQTDFGKNDRMIEITGTEMTS